MLLNVLLFVLGLGVLAFGAEWLVRGATSVAIRFGIRPLVVGLTIVALGTSMPEFLLNAFALMEGEDALAIGNIIGSNISNIGLILGLSAIVLPVAVSRGVLKREYPVMIAVSLLFWGLATDGRMSRMDGFILVAGLILFFFWMIRSARGSSDIPGVDVPSADAPARTGPAARILFLTGGIVALAAGARLMVDAAVSIAHLLEIQPVVIGLTIVAIGTSLPELAASMACAFKKESEMSVGNIVGSNMLNILFVVGVVSVVQPVEVESSSVRIHFPVMMGISLLLYPLARSGYVLSRAGGVLLLTAFIAYMGYLIHPYIQ